METSQTQHADFPNSSVSAPAAYVVKQLDTREELIQSYRLRYRIYENLGYLRQPNASRLEIDEYDACAIPFGAFDGLSHALIGTLRLVTTEAQPTFSRLIKEIPAIFADERLAMQVRSRRPHLLPSIVSKEIDQALAVFNREHIVVSELSRAVVAHDFRGSGVSRSLMELGLARAAIGGPSLLIGSFLPMHLPMYAKYGYLKLPQTGFDLFDSVGQVAIAGVCRTDRLPQPTRSHVDDLLHAMRTNAAEHTTSADRGARIQYRFRRTPGIWLGTTQGRLTMDVQNLIELFEIESGTLNSLVRQHGDLAPSFSRDFKGVDLNKLKLSYLQFLKMKADYVQFTCPAFRAAGEALSAGDEEDVRWSKVFLDYSTGETDEEEGYGHEVWARNDMKALGAPPSLVEAPPHASAAVYGEYFVKEAARHPYAILGAKGVLEHLSIIMADDIADGLLESRIPGAENATTFFRHHGVLDIEHVREGDHNLEQSLKDPRKIQQVFDGVCFTGTVYRWMLKSYVSHVS
jgi:predicted GNAT family N-acyltransferase